MTWLHARVVCSEHSAASRICSNECRSCVADAASAALALEEEETAEAVEEPVCAAQQSATTVRVRSQPQQ